MDYTDSGIDSLLVFQVKLHVNLYDKSNEFYENKKRRQNSWKSISKKLELDGKQLIFEDQLTEVFSSQK